MVGAQLITAAAAAPVLPLLHGPVRTGTVLGALTQAVILGVDTADGPRVLSLLAPVAAAVPNGLRVGAADAGILGRPRPGDAVSVGAGRIALCGAEVRVVRTWTCRVRRIAVQRRGVDTVADLAAPRPLGVTGELVAALQSALESIPTAPAAAVPPEADRALRAAVRQLIGRGLGLTPGGDDVVAGALCGLRATGATGVARALAADALADVTAVTDRTTLLSADLLRLAAHGDACLEVLGVLRAAHRDRDILQPNYSALTVAIDRLLRVGHTSGTDLATGLVIGLRVGARAVPRERSEVG